MTLQVAFNNQIISNSVVFEYKARALPTLPSSQHDWLSLDGKSSARVTLPNSVGEGHLGTRGDTGGRVQVSMFLIRAGGKGASVHPRGADWVSALPWVSPWDGVSLGLQLSLKAGDLSGWTSPQVAERPFS